MCNLKIITNNNVYNKYLNTSLRIIYSGDSTLLQMPHPITELHCCIGEFNNSIYPFVLSVGGIYTVIRSKAQAAVDALGNKYCLIGLYNDLQCKTEVEMMEPEDPCMKGAVQALRDSGVEVQ